jgi:hypothetical protein
VFDPKEPDRDQRPTTAQISDQVATRWRRNLGRNGAMIAAAILEDAPEKCPKTWESSALTEKVSAASTVSGAGSTCGLG